MEYFKVKVFEGRYIKWCDDIWFETTKNEPQLFTRDEAENKVKQLRKHYIYRAQIVTMTNEEVEDCKKREQAKKQEQQAWYNISLNMIKEWKRLKL